MSTHPTVAQRGVAGTAARARVPLEEHATWSTGPQRADPVAILEAQGETRVRELLPSRYGRMLASPFAFYRGAAAVMAADLGTTPVSGIPAQVCGDAHLVNFDLYASPERSRVFSVNDVDETYPGPWEWDVQRLAASLVVAARGNDFGTKATRRIVTSCVRRYREAMADFAAVGHLEVWYAASDVARVRGVVDGSLDKAQRKTVDRLDAKARTRDSRQALGKMAEVVDGRWRIRADPPFVVPIADLLPDVERRRVEAAMVELMERYAQTLESHKRVLLGQYEFSDLARKVVGVGSVGTRCWIVLLRGRDADDPLFLQVKEAQRSVLADQLPAPAAELDHDGARVVVGQRLMQTASDIFLGWARVDGIDGRSRDFYVRQLRDWKGSLQIETLVPRGLDLYGQVCAWTLARAHARSGDRLAIAAYLGDEDPFNAAVTRFAERYADQNELDHAALAEAVRTGRVTAAERLG